MKKLITLLTIQILLGWNSASSQAFTAVDAEFQSVCMIDSVSSSVQIYFNRRVNMINPAQYTDHTQNYSGSYTVVGTAKPCNYQDVVKECWLKLQNVTYINYEYSADASNMTEDMWIVDWTYVEKKSVSSFANSQTPLINIGHVPLAYPYGNSYREAARFENDLIEWLDCQGICYKDDTPYDTEATPTGVGSAYTSLRGLRVSATVYGIEFINLYYSRNPNDPGRYDLARAGTKTNVTSTPCDLPFDLYRRISNGSQAWGVNWQGTVEYPPYTGLLTKVACEFADNRRDDCNRPSGSSEYWISRLDTQICNYYLSIPANENITGLWLRGVNILGGTYEPDGGGVSGKDFQDLTDTLNDYIINVNGMGEFAINNLQGTTYGWRITAKWINHTFDSVQTNVGKKYPEINGCQNYKTFRVNRNELGGIVSCADENGKRCYLPEDAIRINPGMENTIYDCLNTNTFGSEVIASGSTKTFDLSKFHYFSYVAMAGTGTANAIESKDRTGTTTNFNVERGFSDAVTAETACDYLKGTLKFVETSGGSIKVSYLW